ncbi:MAG: DUF6607 family protein [Verrucomicrobiales bacterium]
MKRLFALSLILLGVLPGSANETTEKFDRDRAAILAMAGAYEVEFHFEETVALTPDYELTKPYKADALELVKVVEDTGKQITLQHLLIVDLDEVIKHWAQVWTYEDTHSLNFEGNLTWLPTEISKEEAAGTWTQLVTQVDDSPRYKASGTWTHDGNYSAWTSQPSTRPLPRREYTKRSDYDLLRVVNRHIITPDGWVHTQDNRKYVRRHGESRSICLERGMNRYVRVTDEDQLEEFQVAETYWDETRHFWADVRHAWLDILTTSQGPVHYVAKATEEGTQEQESKSLMRRMSRLAKEAATDSSSSRKQIDALISEHLR